MGDNSTYVQCFMFQRNIPLTSFFMLSVYLRYFVSWLSFLKTIQHKFSRGFFFCGCIFLRDWDWLVGFKSPYSVLTRLVGPLFFVVVFVSF